MPNGGLGREKLHQTVISALDGIITNDPDIQERPLEINLKHPFPSKLRIYLYTVTKAGGSRPSDEFNIQVFIPGTERGESGSFDHSDDRLVVLLGYHQGSDVFVFWDAYMHSVFSFSETVQVKWEAIEEAVNEGVSTQTRHLKAGDEVVVVGNRASLTKAILKRVRLTTNPLPEGANPVSESEEDTNDHLAVDYDAPEEQETTTTRIIRDTEIVNQLKEEYGYRCQVCNDRRKRGEDAYYIEGHHIKPLKDGGPDDSANIVVLCPNHHADFDYGMIKVDPDSLQIIHPYDDIANSLSLVSGHDIDRKFLEYNNSSVAKF